MGRILAALTASAMALALFAGPASATHENAQNASKFCQENDDFTEGLLEHAHGDCVSFFVSQQSAAPFASACSNEAFRTQYLEPFLQRFGFLEPGQTFESTGDCQSFMTTTFSPGNPPSNEPG